MKSAGPASFGTAIRSSRLSRGPVFTEHLFFCNKYYVATVVLTLADEVSTFEIRSQANDVERSFRFSVILSPFDATTDFRRI
jgi:hypothetical protein